MGFTLCFLCVNVSSLGLKYKRITAMVSTSRSVPRTSLGWGRVAQELLFVALAMLHGHTTAVPGQWRFFSPRKESVALLEKSAIYSYGSASLSFFVGQCMVSYVSTLKSCEIWVKNLRRKLTGNWRLSDPWFLLLLPPVPPIFCIQNVRFF